MSRRRPQTAFALLVYLAGLPLAGCLPFPDTAPTSFTASPDLEAEVVVAAADYPAGLAFAPDGRVFFTEKNSGRIRVIADGELLATPFAEVPVNHAGQRGLLGIALHPDFAANGRVYVFYTRSDTGRTTGDPQAVLDNRVVYFVADGNQAAGGEIFVASLPAATADVRIGGRIAFDAEAALYVAIGDLTDAASAQRASILVGKVLRYNDDGSIPADNPIVGSPLFARGLRDVRGLAFDPDSGAGFLLDRNSGGRHELNRLAAGRNYGWPDVTGQAKTPAQLEYVENNPDYADPLYDSADEQPGVVGGSFNPSTRYGPGARMHFFYGEAEFGRVRRVELSDARTAVVRIETFTENFPSPITDVAFTPAGTLYVACEDAIYRLVPTR